MNEERILEPKELGEDNIQRSLRPKTFKEYIGQQDLKEKMNIFIKAAKMRNESLDHILLYGPPGLGKTTLAGVIATEMGVNLKITTGPVLEKAGDLAAILTSLEENDILFIDEIHRLNTSVEEILYPAMEDGELDILIGKGPSARSIRVELPQFTLIGATTRAGQLSTPLRDRFGVTHRMEYYQLEDLKEIIRRGANILNVSYDEDGITEIAKRSRGTPRIANRLLKRARDFALVEGSGILEKESVDGILRLLGVDDNGLDELDRNILLSIINVYNGGPVGIETLSLLLGEDRRTIEEVYEPYLVKIGFIKRTPRGRVVTEFGYRHLGIEKIFSEINFTKNDLLIILGDSCDRGEYTYEMYRKYIDLKNEGYKVIHLIGNHEDTILKSRNDLNHKANWMFNGGERTVYSFFRHQNKFEEIIDYWEEFYKEKWLFDFFEEMPHIVESENCIFVHAGIDFSKSLENQDETYVVWTRDDWYMKNNTGKIVFYGHTPQNEVTSYNNCFNLDSGAFHTDIMNCFELKTKTLYRLKNDSIGIQKINIGKVSEKKKSFFRIIKDILDI